MAHRAMAGEQRWLRHVVPCAAPNGEGQQPLILKFECRLPSTSVDVRRWNGRSSPPFVSAVWSSSPLIARNMLTSAVGLREDPTNQHRRAGRRPPQAAKAAENVKRPAKPGRRGVAAAAGT